MRILKMILIAAIDLLAIIALGAIGVLILKIIFDFVVNDVFNVKHLIWIGCCLFAIVVSLTVPFLIKNNL